jgi:nitrogen fixation/metabolism regulation signal transduction histidine kinase
MASSRSSLRWALVVSAVAAAGAALVLVFLLAVTTNNSSFYERHYTWLLWFNVGVAAMLGLVIALATARLTLRMWHGKFGSRLLFKLAAIFALVGVLPGALIYTVSFQFVSRSIQSWFDVEVEGALNAGLNLGRSTLQVFANELATQTRVAAMRSADAPERLQPLALERLREQLSAQSVALLGGNGQILAVARDVLGTEWSMAERPGTALLRQARAAQVVARLEGLDQDPPGAAATAASPAPRVRAVAFIPSSDLSLGRGDRYLQVTQQLPSSLAADALAVQSAHSEYQQRALGREGLRKMYIGTLTLTLILAVFSALLMAAALGQQIARPLLVLAEGVAQVGRGDLRPTEVFASRDELGGLTRSFAQMTQQLADARAMVQRSLGEVESAKTHLQSILDNLTAGVLLFDHDSRIDTANPGATRILRLPLAAYVGRTLADVPGLADFARAVQQRFDTHGAEPEAGERGHWQESMELHTGSAQAPVMLLVRGAELPDGARLVVFDDITEVVSAQRSVAWAEVARRLAHEIKNPLTPIQLSAERLLVKLAPRLEGTEQQMLAKSVDTIVNQVQAMKLLVNEFRDYARMAAAKLVPLELNGLVHEVLSLYGSAQESGRLQARCGQGLPLIMGDASQLRQVIHNLVQNALEAVAERGDGQVMVRTEAIRGENGAVRFVRLRVMDNGPGFPEKVLKRAFEPYVTTKPRGTGLGLAVVQKIVEEHGARVRATNLYDEAAPTTAAALLETVHGPLDTQAAPLDPPQRPVRGAQVSISFATLAGAESAEPARPIDAGSGRALN